MFRRRGQAVVLSSIRRDSGVPVAPSAQHLPTLPEDRERDRRHGHFTPMRTVSMRRIDENVRWCQHAPDSESFDRQNRRRAHGEVEVSRSSSGVRIPLVAPRAATGAERVVCRRRRHESTTRPVFGEWCPRSTTSEGTSARTETDEVETPRHQRSCHAPLRRGACSANNVTAETSSATRASPRDDPVRRRSSFHTVIGSDGNPAFNGRAAWAFRD